MLRRGEIKGRQPCAGAPWVIRAEDLVGFAKQKRRPPDHQTSMLDIFLAARSTRHAPARANSILVLKTTLASSLLDPQIQQRDTSPYPE
jgi:hypothetical protein